MKKIALATYSQPDSYKSETLLRPPLIARGHDVDILPWDDVSIDWSIYDAVVIRSTWNYHHHIDQFKTWLNILKSTNTQILNPADLIRWNMNKVYLRELADAGIPILKSAFIGRGKAIDLIQKMRQHGLVNAVVKPTISASGDNTWFVNEENIDEVQGHVTELIQHTGMIIQEFAPEISNGEYALMFFNGVFSHAVLKVPAQGNFLVHEERGGHTKIVHVSTSIIAQASKAIEKTYAITGHMPTYARVDGIVRHGVFVLMELELIEPEMFLKVDYYAVDRFADAIHIMLES